MQVLRIFIATAVLLLTACASSPPYVAAEDAADYGYYSQKISADRYRVSFNGTHRAEPTETRAFVLRRAAELTLSEGYQWFRIVNRESAQTSRPATHADMHVHDDYRWYRRCGLLTCTDSVVREPNWSAHARARGETRAFHYSIEIFMTQDAPTATAEHEFYNAESVLNVLAESA